MKLRPPCIKGGVFLDHRTDKQLLKNGSASFN